MAQTFSQSLTGINAGTRFTAKAVQVGDADTAGNALNSHERSWRGPMQLGTQILCKNADGSQSWYTIDAERTVPGGPLVMRPV